MESPAAPDEVPSTSTSDATVDEGINGSTARVVGWQAVEQHRLLPVGPTRRHGPRLPHWAYAAALLTLIIGVYWQGAPLLSSVSW